MAPQAKKTSNEAPFMAEVVLRELGSCLVNLPASLVNALLDKDIVSSKHTLLDHLTG